jgi:hypothetical protein
VRSSEIRPDWPTYPSLAISKGLASLNPGNRFLSRKGRDNAGIKPAANRQHVRFAEAVAQAPYLSPCGVSSRFAEGEFILPVAG